MCVAFVLRFVDRTCFIVCEVPMCRRTVATIDQQHPRARQDRWTQICGEEKKKKKKEEEESFKRKYYCLKLESTTALARI